MHRTRALVIAALLASTPLQAQDTASVTVSVTVQHGTTVLPDVIVRSGELARTTDSRGIAAFRLRPGVHRFVTAKIGFRADSLDVVLRSGVDTSVTMTLVEQPFELTGIIVSATRSGRRVEDEPLRVEVLAQEEVEEKLLMTPGDITMMLNESSGLRVQTTSPSLGGANVRVQGLRGRYTQILSDGLPLYGGQTGGLGLLQIPPMDLGGVEIIKGVSSALYGGSALGGVINLVSRRPGDEDARQLLLNQTTLGGTDAVGFASDQLRDGWGYTLLVGGHRQRQVDKDDDGWADLPGYERALVRPRAFWSSDRGHTAMLTTGATIERREGGTMRGATVPGGGEFPEGLRTNRYDAGLVTGFLLNGASILTVRGAAALQRHRHTFGGVRERDSHASWLGETSLTISQGVSLWVIGVTAQRERYRADDVAGFDYTFTTPGAFVQNTIAIAPALSISASARVDRHSEYGPQLAPRLSALARVGPRWTIRLSGGAGYFAPSPFTEETEVIGLARVRPLSGMREERAVSTSVDVGGTIGPVEVNATAFASEVRHPLGLREAPSGPADPVILFNVDGPTRTAGSELLLRWNPEPWHVTGSYTFVRSREEDPETGVRRPVPLTPQHQAGLVTMWEREDVARAGLEIYYTGRQTLEDQLYRTHSRPYVHVGVLAERRFGRARVFVNAENLLNHRQTHHDPLLRPSRGLGGRWTVDVWGPLEGRVANAGVRLDLR